MINLKTEEFVLEGPPLQSLQQLIQWVGDFVLYLLANLPNQVSSCGNGFTPSLFHLCSLLVLFIQSGRAPWSGPVLVS